MIDHALCPFKRGGCSGASCPLCAYTKERQRTEEYRGGYVCSLNDVYDTRSSVIMDKYGQIVSYPGEWAPEVEGWED
jgi:hypothetical protein